MGRLWASPSSLLGRTLAVSALFPSKTNQIVPSCLELSERKRFPWEQGHPPPANPYRLPRVLDSVQMTHSPTQVSFEAGSAPLTL